MQRLNRVAPVLPVDEIVEVRDDVIDRATAHAKWGAAVHAARALDLGLIRGQMLNELA